jgi:hypothetical protein
MDLDRWVDSMVKLGHQAETHGVAHMNRTQLLSLIEQLGGPTSEKDVLNDDNYWFPPIAEKLARTLKRSDLSLLIKGSALVQHVLKNSSSVNPAYFLYREYIEKYPNCDDDPRDWVKRRCTGIYI